MNKKLSSFISLAGLVSVAALCMGAQACTEPKEYCRKNYESKIDQNECNEYCDSNADFKADKVQIQACEFGQLSFLSGTKESAAETVLICERSFKDDVVVKACRAGVTKEELRTSKIRKSQGSASDRETGNNR